MSEFEYKYDLEAIGHAVQHTAPEFTMEYTKHETIKKKQYQLMLTTSWCERESVSSLNR